MAVDLKYELKRIGKGLLLFTAIYSFIIYFNLTWYWIIITLITVNAGMMFYQGNFSISRLFRNILAITGIVLLFRFLGGYGTIGVIAIVILACLYILLRKRKEYMSAKYQVEEMIWGKPLKDFITEGKKPPKIKITGFRRSKNTSPLQSENTQLKE